MEETKAQHPWAANDGYDDNKSDKSGVSSNLRSISIAKPSIRKDILTVDDYHKGMLEKQSPKFLKQW